MTGFGRSTSRFRSRRAAAIAASAALLTGLCVASGTASTAHAASAAAASPGKDTSHCDLGNGVKHVVQITFDNVHFFRDNPNVPSDLEQMPNLLDFFEDNGTFLSNNHTPLIAHTADDILTTYTGLYGDRQGMPVSNDYQVYNTDGPGGTYGDTDNAGSFAYWTDPVYYADGAPAEGADTNPNMVYSPVPPATAKVPVTPDTITPAPWVPFTRAGCNVGEIATANAELENTSVDIPKVFGVGSPEDEQLINDPDSFKDPETADYVGVAVHCAQGSAFCAGATATKYGQATPSKSAVPDLLPDEPGGYSGYQALFGHKYLAPQLGAGTPNLSRDGYQVTNAAGNLVDLNGNEIDGAFLNNYPGFPGYDSINASQSLAYAADMLSSGVPVVDMYISDLHGNESIQGLSSKGEPCYHAGDALGSGSACYVAQAAYYNQAFGTFFKRLAAEGITPANTMFVLSSDEGDHEAGANVGRAVQPTPASCDGVTVSGATVTPDVPCTYPTGSFGELQGNVTGLLAEETGDTTKFGMEYDTAPEYYINGDPSEYAPQTRQFDHDVASLTADNPYTGATQKIANYLADPTEEGILHMVNADPARTPTLAEFAKPDYYLEQGSATCDPTVTGTTSSDATTDCVTVDDGFAWDHGDYAAEINTNYVGFAGPGVRHLGLDGSGPADGPSSAGPDSGQTTVVGSPLKGPWTDETDIQPTELYLLGLHADYVQDGRVITQILADPNRALLGPDVTALGACYKQLNSSVGEFGAATLTASTSAIESATPGDLEFRYVNDRLSGLEKERDQLAIQIKDELYAAENWDVPVAGAAAALRGCQAIIGQAQQLAGSVSGS
ncbi:MAG TPA: hypothetical protein VMU95_38715 [Trebonia sp.]|nr:hypothetical protein [Trebonia sp.]